MVYCILFPDNKKYIGQCCDKYEKRSGKDFCRYKTQPVYNWIKGCKYDVMVIPLLEHLSQEEANIWERKFIERYNTFYEGPGSLGYNFTFGGDGTVGHSLTEEHKKKISETRKELFRSGALKIESEFFGKGHIMTEATKEKISQKRRENEKKNPSVGRKHSEETKIKLREKQISSGSARELTLVSGKKKKTFNTLAEAAVFLSVNPDTITRHIKANSPIKGYSIISDKEIPEPKKPKACYCICISTGERLDFESQNQAANALHISKQGISKCCLGKQKSCGDYRWFSVE